MEPERFLIDSNSVIDYLGGKMPPDGMAFLHRVVNAGPVVSVITKIEVLGYNAPPDDAQLLIEFVDVASVIGLTNDIVVQTIGLRKSHKIKTPDAIIAATALELGLTLISRNTTDFRNIVGLKLINPHELVPE